MSKQTMPDKKSTKLSSFCVDHLLLLGQGPTLKAVNMSNVTPLKEIEFSFASRFQLQIASQ